MWIKLSDRKPLYGDYSVLVAHPNGSVEMCHVDDLRWGCSGYTHWMDLPSPPNSEQAESPATDTQQPLKQTTNNAMPSMPCPACGCGMLG